MTQQDRTVTQCNRTVTQQDSDTTQHGSDTTQQDSDTTQQVIKRYKTTILPLVVDIVESCRETDVGELTDVRSEADEFSEAFDVVALIVVAGSAVEVTDWVTSLSPSALIVPSGLDQRVCCLESQENIHKMQKILGCHIQDQVQQLSQ